MKYAARTGDAVDEGNRNYQETNECGSATIIGPPQKSGNKLSVS